MLIIRRTVLSATIICQTRVARSRTGSTMTTSAGVAVEKVPLDNLVHCEGHLLEGAHEVGGGDHHRLLLAANSLLFQSQVETGPVSQIGDQTSNEGQATWWRAAMMCSLKPWWRR
ncbi:hypothetical protein TYRP_012205 [Tyrophagus putrescentiae]|nr:hypothetical protein TYRP_012205 [Tyrophagus putrescentiae]